ncbi:MAG: DUF2304 domain-containing protein [Lachnospiraceae bacterium]|nr:DUF2304 domain-containing protein [Lachnospiraceae bacterium]
MLPLKLRVMLGIALVIYFSLIVVLLKRKAIELKYTLLWILAGGGMIILVVFPAILPFILSLLGIVENMNGLFVIMITFLMMLCMSLTSIVSEQAGKIRSLTQSIGIIENELRNVKKKLDDKD